MKTSNKILLGTFLTVILILVGVHVAIYAKFKKGDYVLVSDDDMWPNMITQSLSNIKYVSIANVGNLTIHAADSNKLRYDKPAKEEQGSLEITQKADTLFLLGKNQSGNNSGKWYRRMNLSLAGSIPVKIINSDLNLEGAKPDFSSVSMDLTLDKSNMEVARGSKNLSGFGSLKINAINNSSINLFDVQANFLDLSLSNSSFEENGFTADSIRVSTDLDSKLQLSGKNLLKTKIISNE
jgi:hypothetical protein